MEGEVVDLRAVRKALHNGKNIREASKTCAINGKALRARVKANALSQTELPDHIPKDKILIRVSDCPPRFEPMEERKKTGRAKNKDPSETQEVAIPEQTDPDKQVENEFRKRKMVNRNPQVWELMKFLVRELTTAETGILYDSIVPYFRSIRVSNETIQNLYAILESDKQTKDLLDRETRFWASLTPAEEKPWRNLYERYWNSKSREKRQNKVVYDPLFMPTYKFSKDLVRATLLLRFLFRQHFHKKKRVRRLKRK